MIKNFKGYILGIDATNIRRGGGVTHLRELLSLDDIQFSGFSKIIVWGNANTLSLIQDKFWLKKVSPWALSSNLFIRFFWQTCMLGYAAKSNKCDVVLIPGSTYLGNFRPFVVISQNMLPFEKKELSRYGFSFMYIKLKVLKFLQSFTFKNSNGLIFLSKYAQREVGKIVNFNSSNSIIIPHGINFNFFFSPKQQLDIESYSNTNKYKILYVSIIDMYKHQWNVVKAIRDLYYEGYSVEITFIGGNYPPALSKLNNEINKDPNSFLYVNYLGEVSYEKMHTEISKADLFLFASTCENLPNILIEGMASGLPILSSYYGPMCEVLEDSGLYFNPEDSNDIKISILKYLKSRQLRSFNANLSSTLAKKYNWSISSANTFSYLNQIANQFYA